MPRDRRVRPVHKGFRAPTNIPFTQASQQIGSTGIKRVGPFVREEYLTELHGSTGRAKYREMWYHDPQIRRAMWAVKLPMLQAEWEVQGGEGPDAVLEKAYTFVYSCLSDMSYTWWQILNEIIVGTGLYGASWSQSIYKRRMGPDQKDGSRRSEYDDGLIGWRKWSFRGQETWNGWEWDEDGDVSHLKQLDPYTGTIADVPLDLSLHWLFEGRLGDPEGLSLFRSAYWPYYCRKHIQRYEMIVAERMGGVPIFKVTDPELPLFDTEDEDMAAMYAHLQNSGTAWRVDEQSTIIAPYGVDVIFQQPGPTGFDTSAINQRYAWEILGCVLAQFLELGQAPHGSYSKSESDQDFFLAAMEAVLYNCIAATINRYELPRLFYLNRMSFPGLVKLPQLVPSALTLPNLDSLAEPLSKLTAAGLITADPMLEVWLRARGKLPEMEDPPDVEKRAAVRSERDWRRFEKWEEMAKDPDSEWSADEVSQALEAAG